MAIVAEKKRLKFYFYHMYDGKMILDEGENIFQLRAHYKDDPKFGNDVVAAVLEPLSEKTLQKYLDQYQITHDPAKRGPLRPFTPQPFERPLRG